MATSTTTTSPPRLVVVAERELCGSQEVWVERLRILAEACARHRGAVLQLRWARASAAARDAALRAILDELESYRTVLLVNRPSPPPATWRAHHWHLPERGLSSLRPEERAPDGVAVHGIPAARRAIRAGARWLQFGPVFDPGSKPGRGVGTAPLEAIVQAISSPVIAVGGLRPDRIPEVIAAGASGVAVASGILCAEDPALALEQHLAALDS